MTDDILFVWKFSKRVSPEDFKSYVRSIKSRIQFTLDMEKDRILNFTDLTITTEGKKIVMKVYRKDTHTNKYIYWKTNVPMVTKKLVLYVVWMMKLTIFNSVIRHFSNVSALKGAFLKDPVWLDLMEKSILILKLFVIGKIWNSTH